VPSPGKPTREAPHLHINNVNAYHSRLKQWLVPFKGVATKNLPNYLGWRRAIEAWGDKLEPSKALSATGHINRQRYKSLTEICGQARSHAIGESNVQKLRFCWGNSQGQEKQNKV
jgi:hypothetical protein